MAVGRVRFGLTLPNRGVITGATTVADAAIGGGSAGCGLANRLSEDPSTRMILIEAGGRDWNPFIHVPGRLYEAA